jgi:hypothetical protein
MIDKATLSPAAEPLAPRQDFSLSRDEAEGKRDEFREAMRQDAETGRAAEPFASRQDASLSGAEAEGNGNGFREAVRRDVEAGPAAESFALRQGPPPSSAEAGGDGNGFREALRQDTGKSSGDGSFAPRQESPLSSAEAEGDGFRGLMPQDAEKGGIPGKPEGRPGSEAAGAKLPEVGRELQARDEKADPAPLPPPFSGDALLRGLGVSYAPLETQAAAASPAPGAPSDAPALAADLAERILVNADNRAAGGEVRITLKEAVLPETEILLRREGERLVVQLVSGNSASLDALRLAREDLHGKLLDLDREVSVEVLDKQSQENGDTGHSGRRSRGLDYFPESER